MATVAERISAEYPFLTVLLVPRHPHKFDERSVKSLFVRQIQFLAAEDYNLHGGEIAWVNQMGVLAAIYEMAEIAVVGGTFCDIGGHDLVEPFIAALWPSMGRMLEAKRIFTIGWTANPTRFMFGTLKS